MAPLSKIVAKIFHHDKPAMPRAQPGPSASLPPHRPWPRRRPSPAPTPSARVDVEAVLASMAKIEGAGGNWRTWIVDLLKLLKLDCSLEARKALAEQLGVHAGEPGGAEQNIALKKAVMKKLATMAARPQRASADRRKPALPSRARLRLRP